MDWYSWLSKTKLEPILVYEYGLALVRNKVEKEDVTYFNHEFLQSIGISVAKHRLEILKLARKEDHQLINKDKVQRGSRSSSILVLAINKTRKLITRNISKLGSSPNDRSPWSGAVLCRRMNIPIIINGAKQNKQQDHGKAVMVSNSIRNNMMWSGPLQDNKTSRVQNKYMMTTGTSHHHTVHVSGPLDGKMQERIIKPPSPNWSPMVPMPTDGRRSGFICRSPTSSVAIDRLGLSPQLSYYRSGAIDNHDHDHGVQSLWSLMFQDMKPT